MKSLQRIFQWKLRYHQTKAFFFFVLSWLVTRLIFKEQDLWLLSERGTDARDNGFWMFKYIVENHPEINVKYIIDNESEDKKKFSQWNKSLIPYNSFRHYLIMWQARYLISTHIGGYLPYYIGQNLLLRNIFHRLVSHSKIIWLQHGIIKDNLTQVHYGQVYLDLFICGAKPEYDYVIQKFGYPNGVVHYTGLARFDGLHHVEINKGQILLMPTWRWWLLGKDFLSSVFFQIYSRLLSDVRLHKLLILNGLHLVFYPHHEVQPYISSFEQLNLPECIHIANHRDYDVQQLLKESALLITDYSSVFFDFIYMQKPVVYFQFDEKEFREKHYAEGYYDYHHGLGDWCGDVDSLICTLQRYVDNGFAISNELKKIVEVYFPLHDQHNCERIYSAILRLHGD